MNRIRELREKRSLTLRGLGKKINMSSSRISQYETGKREPKIETWNKLAKFFQVPTSYLMGLSNDVNGWDEWAKNTGYSVKQIKDEIKRLVETKRLDSSSNIQHQIGQAVQSLDNASYSTTQGTQSELVFQLTRLISNVDDAFLEPPKKKQGVLKPVPSFKVRSDMDKEAYKVMIDVLTEAKNKIGQISISSKYL